MARLQTPFGLTGELDPTRWQDVYFDPNSGKHLAFGSGGVFSEFTPEDESIGSAWTAPNSGGWEGYSSNYDQWRRRPDVQAIHAQQGKSGGLFGEMLPTIIPAIFSAWTSALAAPALANYFGGGTLGAAGSGAVMGGVRSALTGGDFLTGAVTGGIGGGVGNLAGGGVQGGAITGGVNALLRGGDPLQGAVMGGAMSGLRNVDLRSLADAGASSGESMSGFFDSVFDLYDSGSNVDMSGFMGNDPTAWLGGGGPASTDMTGFMTPETNPWDAPTPWMDYMNQDTSGGMMTLPDGSTEELYRTLGMQMPGMTANLANWGSGSVPITNGGGASTWGRIADGARGLFGGGGNSTGRSILNGIGSDPLGAAFNMTPFLLALQQARQQGKDIDASIGDMRGLIPQYIDNANNSRNVFSSLDTGLAQLSQKTTGDYDNLLGEVTGNESNYVRSQINPLLQAQATGYGNMLESQGARGIRGSSFGDQALTNYGVDTGRGIADATAKALEGSYGLRSGIVGARDTAASRSLGMRGQNQGAVNASNLASINGQSGMFDSILKAQNMRNTNKNMLLGAGLAASGKLFSPVDNDPFGIKRLMGGR